MDRAAFEPGWSVADALDRLAPPDDAALAGAARGRLHALAARLPAALTRVIYLESWIGQPRPRLDLIVKIEPRDRDALAEAARSALGAAPEARSGWVHVARFAREWAAPDSPLHDTVRAAWLEFDLDPRVAPDAALAAPRVFVDFTRQAQCLPSVEARLALAAEVMWALSGVRAPAPAGPPGDGLLARAAATLQSLRACLEHLPAGATLAYLGVFAGEGGPPVVRACVVGLADHLTAYLGAIGWPGDGDLLARHLLAPLARDHGDGAQPVGVLHVDLAPGVCPRIGLEYTFPRPGRPGGLRSAERFLDQLVARGWCTAGNRAALGAWPRRSVELLPHDIWHSQVTRQVAHVKLACTPGEPVVAKAYLRAAFDLVAGGTLVAGRPRRFGAAAGDGARAPSDRGGPPSAAAGPGGAMAHVLARPAVRARGLGGTAVALAGRELGGATGMTLSTAHQEALDQILTRATVDRDFRNALLAEPRKAILDGLGIRIPANFRVKFVERDKEIDALIVLPDLQRQDGELGDDDLDAVAGGADADPSETW